MKYTELKLVARMKIFFSLFAIVGEWSREGEMHLFVLEVRQKCEIKNVISDDGAVKFISIRMYNHTIEGILDISNVP